MTERFPLPNGAVLEIAGTLGQAVPFSALSNAAKPAATAKGHTLKNGDIVLINSGWSLVNNRATRVSDVATDTFVLDGLDTSSVARYSPGAGVGKVVTASNWTQISKVTAFASSGGEQQYLTVGYLDDDDDRQYPTNRTPTTLAITVEDQPSATYVGLIESYGDARQLVVVRLKLPSGDQILYTGYVTITSSPTMERNNLMTRTVSIALSNRPVRYLAA
ncbi:phage tail protein [Pseudomonas cremoricolorata]|uniref:phage tail protein n=1 Tax=Pseudomonas cremoricolorata TaxID=157783 RepID=UPI000420B7B0|nr:phage tail protein [Pseudomonas cremoricolorata]